MIHPWVALAQSSVRFGIGAGPASLAECMDFTRLVEQLGFDSYWVHDHPTRFMDCFQTLAVGAASTTRIRLGTMVGCVFYRNPCVLARLAMDIDRLSSGRLVLGLGIGDDAVEFGQMGIRFPPTAERHQALEETITIIKKLWAGERVTYEGAVFKVRDLMLPALPVQQPHIPLLIGGGGERFTLPQVGRFADMSNFGDHVWTGGAGTAETTRRKLDILHRHCIEADRSPSAILHSHCSLYLILGRDRSTVDAKVQAIPAAVRAMFKSSLIACTPDELVRRYSALIGAGIRYFICFIYGRDVESVELLAHEVVPAVRERDLGPPVEAAPRGPSR